MCACNSCIRAVLLWLNRKNTTKTAATATTTHILNQSLVVKQSVGVFTLPCCWFSFSGQLETTSEIVTNDNDFYYLPHSFVRVHSLSKCKIRPAKISVCKMGQINFDNCDWSRIPKTQSINQLYVFFLLPRRMDKCKKKNRFNRMDWRKKQEKFADLTKKTCIFRFIFFSSSISNN